MNAPVRDDELERQLAEYERQLRQQLLREEELEALALEQAQLARTKKFLPMAGNQHGGPGLRAAS
jgi:hypothetical protein